MANTVSAAKNARKAVRRRAARVAVKSELKTLRKKTLVAAEAKQPKNEIQTLTRQAVKKFAKAASNGYIHARSASRKIGRLMKHIHKLSLAAA